LAFLVPRLGGAVDAYLTVISITDMPLFVIAVVHGLLWRRATSLGAVTGYLAGAGAGAFLKFGLGLGILNVTLGSAVTAFVVCLVASLLSPAPEGDNFRSVFAARQVSEEEKLAGDSYNIVPKSLGGKLSLVLYACGFVIFCCGVVLGALGRDHASLIGGVGMCVYFGGGYLRTTFS
jgi:SSS family solute:Na+ symporter